jgi:hypothetical protein
MNVKEPADVRMVENDVAPLFQGSAKVNLRWVKAVFVILRGFNNFKVHPAFKMPGPRGAKLKTDQMNMLE